MNTTPSRNGSGQKEPAYVVGDRNTRRPITATEAPHLAALGAALAAARHAAGLTQQAAADAAELSRSQLGRIERGERRTRRSTLQRIAQVLDVEVDPLADLAGPALAPESDYADRVARRRARRTRKRRLQAQAAARRLAELDRREAQARIAVERAETRRTMDRGWALDRFVALEAGRPVNLAEIEAEIERLEREVGLR